MEHPVVLGVGPGRTAVAIGVEGSEGAAAAVDALDLDAPRPTLVIVGGAAGLDRQELAGLAPVADALVRVAVGAGAAIVDGGTDAGVMRLVGHAHAGAGARVPLVGVVVRALGALPGEPVVSPMVALEPRHTHFVLVPGSSWGEEAPWIAAIAGLVAGDRPSVTVLVNGGEVAWTDAAESTGVGRRVLAVVGTGRAADALAAAAAGRPGDERAAELVQTGLVEAVALADDAVPSLEERVEDILGSTGPSYGR